MNGEIIEYLEKNIVDDMLINLPRWKEVKKKLNSGKSVIPTKVLKDIFENLCPHQDAYNYKNKEFDWTKCKDCVLQGVIINKYMPNLSTIPVEEDVCFWIWHNSLLEP